jgi:cytochrome c oxidase subunit 1
MFGLFRDDYDEDGFRTCSVTGLEIHESVENHAQLFGLTAVVALVWGGVFAFTVPMTRWELIGLLDPDTYYTHLTLHAWNLLIFWMVFMEVAILYVGGPMVLGRRLPLTKLAKAGWGLMVTGAVAVNYFVWTLGGTNEPPLLTAYVPLPTAKGFYVGVIVFLLGATVAAIPFFVAIWKEKRGNPGRSLPLVSFAAFVTGVIAVEAIVGGISAFVYALAWRTEWIANGDPALYRVLYWTIGHGSQQINLVAMITVWYFLTHVLGGAKVVSEKVSRSAFVLYLFFINMGAAHHLLSDPAVTTGWRVWNTSYAFYGATFASLIHAFAIPAGLEAGRRARGEGGGLLGWLTSAPWKNPAFSATIFSIILFGFLGGTTGVIMGQMQLNMTWHNTLATVGHFHGTVVVGTTLAFMGLVYFLLQTSFGRELAFPRLASAQPYFYGGAMGVVVLMMMYIGLLFGVPRRTVEVVRNIPGTEFSLSAATPLFAVMGIFALLAVLGGLSFVVVALGTLLKRQPLSDGDAARSLLPDGGTATDGGEADEAIHAQDLRGTFAICLAFMAVFVIAYVANWYLLSRLWSIGA